jgi:hypothetical protein
MITMTPLQIAQQAMREFGNAMRGAWGDIDGRSIKWGMDALATELDDPSITIERARYHLDLCPTGGGHWTQYCGEDWITCPPVTA